MTADPALTRRAFLALRTSKPPAATTASHAMTLALSSDELACAQIAEARPFLADEARRLGIATENRSDLDILRDVFAKAHLPAD
jgi:hypothetical protein